VNTTGSNSAKYITAYTEIKSSNFVAGISADIVINMKTNNTGLADNSVFI
jgi:hypothetical protein